MIDYDWFTFDYDWINDNRQYLVAGIVTILFFTFGLRRCKYELAYLYLKYLAKRPERRFITSKAVVIGSHQKPSLVEEHPKHRETIEFHESPQTPKESIPLTEASIGMAEDVISQKVRFEEAVVQLFQRRVCSLPESEIKVPTRATFEDSTHEKIEKREPKFMRRLTYPPDSREQSTHKLDLKESLTKKLNDHRELITSRIDEFSPVFFFRTPREEENMWLEQPRHFHLENTRKTDLMNFFAFDGEGNFIAIWALRRACSHESTPLTSEYKSAIGPKKTISETKTIDPDFQCVAEFFIVINLVGIGSFQLPKGSSCHGCSCASKPGRMRGKASVEEPFFDAGGLRLECVEFMSKWKLTFKGLLSKDGHEDQNNCEVKTHFAFWWNAVSRPFHFQHDFSPKCLASDMSKEHWSSDFFQKFSNWRMRNEINYSQWGGLKGRLKVDEFNKIVVLRGPRVHFFGLLDNMLNKPSALWMIYTEIGHMVHLEATLVKDTLKEFKTGYMCYPDGLPKPITNLTLGNRVPVKKLLAPKIWRFQFTADATVHQVTCEVKNFVQASIPNDMIIQIASIDMSNMKGYAVSCISYKGEVIEIALPARRCDQPSFREFNPINKDFETWTIPLGNPACVNSSLVGIKGCRLAYIYQIPSKNYSVADGICLTSNALEYHLFHHPSIRNAISLLKQKTGVSSPDLIGQCMEVTKLLQDTPLLNEMVWNLEDALMKQFGLDFSNKTFVLRVSSKINDGFRILGDSMRPILNIKGFDKILKTILLCWSAPFSYDSVTFRRENGLKIDVFVSVIIQAMVHPKTCGTIHSNDPSPKHHGRVNVEAKVGINQAEGSFDVDYVLSRDCRNQVSVINKTFSGHRLQTVGSDSLRGLKASISKELSISEAVLTELALCAIEIEQHFGSPQSVDFAIDEKDTNFVFKAMPTLRSPSSDEWLIMHEFDSALATDYEIVLKDMCIGPVTPLTLSLLIPANNDAYTNLIKSVLVFGTSLSNDRCLCSYQNQIFINAHEAMLLAAAADIPRHKTIVELCITGKALDINYEDYHPKFSLIKRLINAIALLQTTISSSRKGEELHYLADNLSICPEGPLTSKRLYESITRNIPTYSRGHFLYLSCFSSPNVWLYGLMTYICEKEEWTANHSFLASMFLSNCSNENISSKFEELRTELIKNEEAKPMMNSDPEVFYDWLKSPSSGRCGELFEKFMNEHGHRCSNELEFLEKSWQKEPLRIVKLLQSMVEKSEYSITTVTQSPVGSSIGFFKRMVINFFLEKIFKGLSLRSRSKSCLIIIHSKFKEAYWMLAERMVQEGRIPSPDLMFFLTHPEIGKLLLTRSPHFLALAWTRKMCMEKTPTPLPFVSMAFLDDQFKYSTYAQGKVIVRGTPISRGNVTGKARVVIKASDSDLFEKGEIIVTPIFEESWSSCLSFIAGIITETGGLLSTGASLARAYGLPCMIDAENATRILKTGDTIHLNGHAGSAQKLSDDDVATAYPSRSESLSKL